MDRLDQSAINAEMIISVCPGIDVLQTVDKPPGFFFCKFPIGRPFHIDIGISSGGLGSIRYSISEYRFFESYWCLSYRKSVRSDSALVGAQKWVGSKNSEFQSFNHGFFQTTFLPNISRYFTER